MLSAALVLSLLGSAPKLPLAAPQDVIDELIAGKSTDALKKALAKRMSPDAVDGYGQPLLYVAADRANAAAVTMLLAAGAKKDTGDKSPLFAAASSLRASEASIATMTAL